MPTFNMPGAVPIFGQSGMDPSSGTGENATWMQGPQTGWGRELGGNQIQQWDLEDFIA